MRWVWIRCAGGTRGECPMIRTVEGGPLPTSARVSPRAGEADAQQLPFRAAVLPDAIHLAREYRASAYEAGSVQRTEPRIGFESSLPRRSFCPAADGILCPQESTVKRWFATDCECGATRSRRVPALPPRQCFADAAGFFVVGAVAGLAGPTTSKLASSIQTVPTAGASARQFAHTNSASFGMSSSMTS